MPDLSKLDIRICPYSMGGTVQWKGSPEFKKRLEADWDRVFGKASEPNCK